MIRPKLGQHFLNSPSILERIARAACPDRESLVIEIGPGEGALTRRLLDRAERLVAIEIDRVLAAQLARKFQPASQLTVIAGDALALDLSQWGAATFAGNLPYYVATPLLARVLGLRDNLRRAVFLIQKEVAQRIAAEPGAADYGYLSVQTKLFADSSLLFTVQPSAFRPPPKVDSAVVELRPNDRIAELKIGNPAEFLAFAGQCFRQKRKTIRNNLAGIYGRQMIDGWPEAGMRAEQLSLEQFAAMYLRIGSVHA